jgi:hypothetical protein
VTGVNEINSEDKLMGEMPQTPQHIPPADSTVTISFTTGDTNMQDWAYRFTVCDDVTAELNGRTSTPKMDAGSS